MKEKDFEIEFLVEEDKKPLILILEDKKTKFSDKIFKSLSTKFKIFSYNNYYQLIKKINLATSFKEKIFSIIIYRSLLPSDFLQFWSFVSSKNELCNLKIFYYYNNIIYGFEGNKKTFAHPLFKINDVDLQITLILDLIELKDRGIA